MDPPNTKLIKRYGHTKPVSYKILTRTREIEYILINEMAEAAYLLVVNKNGEVIEEIEAIKTLHEAQKKVLKQPEFKKILKDWQPKAANLFYLQMFDFLKGKQGDVELSQEVIRKGYEAESSLRNSYL